MIALQSVISIAALLGLAMLFNGYRVDRLRYKLFAIRDELFDDALAGRIQFDSIGYRAIRDCCNGMIRCAHTISLSEFLIHRWLLNDAAVELARIQHESMFAAMSASDRELAKAYFAKAHRAVVVHVFTSPLVLSTLAIPFCIGLATMIGRSWVNFTARKLKEPLNALDGFAISEGRGAASLDPASC